MNAILGIKSHMAQEFTQTGIRVPVSVVRAGGVVTHVKSRDIDGYRAVQLAYDTIKSKSLTKPVLGHLKGAVKGKTAPRFLREVKLEGDYKVGDVVRPADVFKPGDLVKVTGKSRGKGFAGVVKRHGFAGGPKTHGQSDRHRAPGSIGQGTTPGRVYKGKRMAGHMGQEQSTIRDLTVLKVDSDTLWLSGPVPGAPRNLLIIEKIGENKKFQELFTQEPTTETQQAESPQTPSVQPETEEPKNEETEEAKVSNDQDKEELT